MAAVGVITAVCVAIVREHRPDVALVVGIAGGALMLVSIVDYFSGAVGFLTELVAATGTDGSIIKVLFKIVGIGLVAEYAAGIVEESGSKALAEKIVLGGKLVIFAAAIPIIKLLFEIVSSLLP